MSKSKFFQHEMQSDNSNETSATEQSSFVNMEYLSEIINDDDELRELIELFLHQTAEDLVKLKEALATENREEIKGLAHRMLGGSATIGLITITASLRELERMAESAESDQMTSVLTQVEKEFKHTSLFLQELISAHKE